MPEPREAGAANRQYLAVDCAAHEAPTVLDFDEWLAWLQEKVPVAYGYCAIRHRKTVDSWPK